MPPTPPPAQRSVEYWDGWYADKAATPAVGEIMNRHLGLPPDLLAGCVPAEAIPEITAELRLAPGDTLADLACGRSGYGLTIAKSTGARLVGIDLSAEALSAAREQAARLGVPNASFTVGNLTATGLPDGCADAVLCTDSIQFPDEPSTAYREIRRILKPAGRVGLTCWEPRDRSDERLSPRLRRVDLAAGLLAAGFTEVEVRERPAWLERERRIWAEAITLDPEADPEAAPGLRSFHDEAVSSLGRINQLRRVLAVATAP
jgi:SAM-dependent methyltransferase